MNGWRGCQRSSRKNLPKKNAIFYYCGTNKNGIRRGGRIMSNFCCGCYQQNVIDEMFCSFYCTCGRGEIKIGEDILFVDEKCDGFFLHAVSDLFDEKRKITFINAENWTEKHLSFQNFGSKIEKWFMTKRILHAAYTKYVPIKTDDYLLFFRFYLTLWLLKVFISQELLERSKVNDPIVDYFILLWISKLQQ